MLRENRRGNKQWTIQRNWQQWVHKTHDVDKQNATQKTWTPPTTSPQVLPNGKQLLPPIRVNVCMCLQYV